MSNRTEQKNFKKCNEGRSISGYSNMLPTKTGAALYFYFWAKRCVFKSTFSKALSASRTVLYPDSMYSPVSSDRPRWHVPNRLVCSVSLLSLLLRRFSCSDVLPACRIGEGIKLDLKEQVWLGRKLCAQKLRNHRSHPTFSLHFPWQSNNGITGFITQKACILYDRITGFVQKEPAFYMTESQVSSSTHGNEITAFVPTQ